MYFLLFPIRVETDLPIKKFSNAKTLSDYFKKKGTVIKADPNNDIVEKIRELKKGGKIDLLRVNWPDLLHIEKLKIDDREPLRLEQEAFLRAVADKTLTPEVSAEEGLAAMECAEKILASIKEHKWE